MLVWFSQLDNHKTVPDPCNCPRLLVFPESICHVNLADLDFSHSLVSLLISFCFLWFLLLLFLEVSWTSKSAWAVERIVRRIPSWKDTFIPSHSTPVRLQACLSLNSSSLLAPEAAHSFCLWHGLSFGKISVLLRHHLSVFSFHNSLLLLLSVDQSCPTLCNPMDCSTPGLPILHRLLELAQTQVHWVGDAVQPSRPLSSFFGRCKIVSSTWPPSSNCETVISTYSLICLSSRLNTCSSCEVLYVTSFKYVRYILLTVLWVLSLLVNISTK